MTRLRREGPTLLWDASEPLLPQKENLGFPFCRCTLDTTTSPCSSRSAPCQREDLHKRSLSAASFNHAPSLTIPPKDGPRPGPGSWAGSAPHLCLLTGRAASSGCVLVRIGRLVPSLVLRGQRGLGPVIQGAVGSLWWPCGSAWWRIHLADTLLSRVGFYSTP